MTILFGPDEGVEPTPNPLMDGCRWCGVSKREHCQRWWAPVGWHKWVPLEQAEIKARMLARRADRLNAEPTLYHATTAWAADTTGEEGIPFCADCRTDSCRKWIRIQTRLDERRMELDGINPKRRSKTAGDWGGGAPW